MAVRQYIGARYVLKIYENSLDPASAEWEATVNYEPLTMVTYNYGSYLSKKEVPASVGDPASNPSYWVQTGFYNGQIASLQDQIDNINNVVIPAIQNQISDAEDDIETLEKKIDGKVCLLFDSYGGTAGNDTGETGTIPAYLNQISPDTYDAIVSTGNSVGNGGFLNSVTTFCSDPSFDGTKYRAFYFTIGRNEWSSSAADITSKTAELVSYVRSKFPNAKLFYSWIANGDNNSAHGTRLQQYDAYRRLKTAMENNGVTTIYGTECVLHNYAYMHSDGVHPTQNGKLALAWAIHSGLNAGYYETEYNYVNDFNPTAVTGVTRLFRSGNYLASVEDNKAILKPPAIDAYTLSDPIDQSSYASIELAEVYSGTAANYFKYPVYDVFLPFDVCVSDSNGLYTKLPAKVVLTPDGKLCLKEVNANGALRSLNATNIFLCATGTVTIAAHMS